MNPRRADRRRSPTGVKIHARYGVLRRFCSLLELTAGSSLYLSLNSEAQTGDKHTKMPRRAVESKEEKNEKRGEKVIKISGRHPRGQTSERVSERRRQRGLISMKMSLPSQRLPYGCHDTWGAWRRCSHRADYECVHVGNTAQDCPLPYFNVDITSCWPKEESSCCQINVLVVPNLTLLPWTQYLECLNV